MKKIYALLISLACSISICAQVTEISNEYYYDSANQKEDFWSKIKSVFSAKEKNKTIISQPVLTKKDPNRNTNHITKKHILLKEDEKPFYKDVKEKEIISSAKINDNKEKGIEENLNPSKDNYKNKHKNTENVQLGKTPPKEVKRNYTYYKPGNVLYEKRLQNANSNLNQKEKTTTSKVETTTPDVKSDELESTTKEITSNDKTKESKAKEVKRNYTYYKPGNVLYEKRLQNTNSNLIQKEKTTTSKVEIEKNKVITESDNTNKNIKISTGVNTVTAPAKKTTPVSTEKSLDAKELNIQGQQLKKNKNDEIAFNETPKDNVIRNEIKPLSLTNSTIGKSSFFYSGIVSGKIYAVTNMARKGEIIKVTNPSNGKYVFVEVIDYLPAKDIKAGLIIKLSDNAKLPLDQKNSIFNVKINY